MSSFEENVIILWTMQVTEFRFVDHASVYNLVNWKPTWCTIYSQYIYQYLRVLGGYVPIIRRSNCVYATLGTCCSVLLLSLMGT